MNKTLVLFDFDGTLTKRDTFPGFIFFSKGFFNASIGFFLFTPFIILFFLKQISGESLKKKLVAFYFKGMSENLLRQKGKEYIEKLILTNGLNKTIMQNMQEHMQHADEVCIVSASLNIWIEPFCETFKLKHLCTEIKFENGYFLGSFKTPNCNGIEKAIRIKEKYDLTTYSNIIAYGNSSGDKYMFELANKVVLVK